MTTGPSSQCSRGNSTTCYNVTTHVTMNCCHDYYYFQCSGRSKTGLVLLALSRVIQLDTWGQTRCSVWLALISHGNHKDGGLLAKTSGGKENVRRKGTDGARNVRGNTFSHCTWEFVKTFLMRLWPWHVLTAPRGWFVSNGCWCIGRDWLLKTHQMDDILFFNTWSFQLMALAVLLPTPPPLLIGAEPSSWVI